MNTSGGIRCLMAVTLRSPRRTKCHGAGRLCHCRRDGNGVCCSRHWLLSCSVIDRITQSLLSEGFLWSRPIGLAGVMVAESVISL